MATLDVTQKARIYHTLYRLNLSFAAIVGHCRTLQQSGMVRPKLTRIYQAFTQELQGELNAEVLLTLHGVEEDDWARFGKVRDKWEKYLQGSSSRTPSSRSPASKPRKQASRTRKS
ncbi:MAG TPA: hypothetical protein VGK22_13275 [Candidatus Angelobacter sp.]